MSGRRGSRGSGWGAGGCFAPWEQRPGGEQGSRGDGKCSVEMGPRDLGPVVGGLDSVMLQSSWGGVRMVGARGLLRCGIWRDDLELRMGFCGAGVVRSGEEDLGGMITVSFSSLAMGPRLMMEGTREREGRMIVLWQSEFGE